MTESKGPAEHAVDLVVFAPIGFALEARNLLPTFVERGRQQVQMARMIGQFAVSHGQTEGRKRLSQAQAQAETLLHELGLSTHVSNADGAAPPPAGRREASGAPVVPPVRAAAPVAQASAASADLAIADYDSLAASHVIPRLAGLDTDELEAVRAYESAHRARKTILGRIAQLQGG